MSYVITIVTGVVTYWALRVLLNQVNEVKGEVVYKRRKERYV